MASHRLLLVGFIGLAAVLRLVGLDVQSLWHDELFSWYASQLPTLAEAIRFGAIEDVHPPGYIVSMYAWQRVAGDSAVALRLPSALAGIATIPWAYALGRRWRDRAVGLRTAALLSASWMAVYYSQEARAYGLLLLGIVALAERTLALVDRPSDAAAPWGLLTQLAALSVGLAYLHYFGLMVAI
ncbi:MAG TPA: hypothetical protein ENK18_21870, partial [Deltaproteobacteria bacterium]|nr:hypothetical protein [Deltaproteobacteria bacterium]